jgi:hypothetical protein
MATIELSSAKDGRRTLETMTLKICWETSKIYPPNQSVEKMTEKEEFNLEDTLLTKDFIKFPEELNKKCTQEEFHKMITSHNSDIHIDEVNFLDYPDK